MGIFIYNVSPNTANITDNSFIGCRSGIVVLSSENVTIANNYCSYNLEYGIVANIADGIVVKNNTCNFNQNDEGIELITQSPTVVH